MRVVAALIMSSLKSRFNSRARLAMAFQPCNDAMAISGQRARSYYSAKAVRLRPPLTYSQAVGELDLALYPKVVGVNDFVSCRVSHDLEVTGAVCWTIQYIFDTRKLHIRNFSM